MAVCHSSCLIKLRVDLDAHLTSALASHVKTMTDLALKLTMAPSWLAQEHWLWLCVICQAPVHSAPFRLIHSPPSSKSEQTIHSRATHARSHVPTASDLVDPIIAVPKITTTREKPEIDIHRLPNTIQFKLRGQTIHARATHACSHVPTASDLVDPTIAVPKFITTREKPGIDIHRLPNTMQFKLESTADIQLSPVPELPRQMDGLSTSLLRQVSLSQPQSHLTHLTPPSILLACYDHQKPSFAGAQELRCRFRTSPVSRRRCPAKRNEKAHRVSGRVDIEGSKINVAMNAWLAKASYFYFIFPYRPRRPPLGGGGGMVPFRAGDWKCGSEGCGYHNFATSVVATTTLQRTSIFSCWYQGTGLLVFLCLMFNGGWLGGGGGMVPVLVSDRKSGLPSFYADIC